MTYYEYDQRYDETRERYNRQEYYNGQKVRVIKGAPYDPNNPNDISHAERRARSDPEYVKRQRQQFIEWVKASPEYRAMSPEQKRARIQYIIDSGERYDRGEYTPGEKLREYLRKLWSD